MYRFPKDTFGLKETILPNPMIHDFLVLSPTAFFEERPFVKYPNIILAFFNVLVRFGHLLSGENGFEMMLIAN